MNEEVTLLPSNPSFMDAKMSLFARRCMEVDTQLWVSEIERRLSLPINQKRGRESIANELVIEVQSAGFKSLADRRVEALTYTLLEDYYTGMDALCPPFRNPSLCGT